MSSHIFSKPVSLNLLWTAISLHTSPQIKSCSQGSRPFFINPSAAVTRTGIWRQWLKIIFYCSNISILQESIHLLYEWLILQFIIFSSEFIFSFILACILHGFGECYSDVYEPFQYLRELFHWPKIPVNSVYSSSFTTSPESYDSSISFPFQSAIQQWLISYVILSYSISFHNMNFNFLCIRPWFYRLFLWMLNSNVPPYIIYSLIY